MKSAAELFWPRVEVGWTDECWEWTGPTLKNGYGQFGSGKNRGISTLAHRVSYIMIKGDPGELQVDHLCHNKICVNPQHLEAVTPQVNTQRAHDDGLIKSYRNGNTSKTHCRNGHEFDARIGGRRACRRCHNEYHKNWMKGRRSAQPQP